MAFLEFKNVRIAGISAGVPKNVVSNILDDAVHSKDYDSSAFVESTGVKERHVSDFLTTSDLGYEAAERLIKELGWNKTEIGAIIFVSQSADYIFPASACILQNRLSLNKDCYAEDISLGCSGWVYGMSNAASLLGHGTITKALVISGDAKGRINCEKNPLFGHAATVTALEYSEVGPGLFFDFGTDGSGYDAIITPDGGSRNGINEKSFILEDFEGQMKSRLQARMKGMDVFAFGISTAPKSVKNLMEHCNTSIDDVDYLVLHQANKKMNDIIAKKLKVTKEKVPSSMYLFGNTSSASIPLTIVTELRDKIGHDVKKIVCCGFGVGLSWGSVLCDCSNVVIPEVIEVDDSAANLNWV